MMQHDENSPTFTFVNNGRNLSLEKIQNFSTELIKFSEK